MKEKEKIMICPKASVCGSDTCPHRKEHVFRERCEHDKCYTGGANVKCVEHIPKKKRTNKTFVLEVSEKGALTIKDKYELFKGSKYYVEEKRFSSPNKDNPDLSLSLNDLKIGDQIKLTIIKRILK